MTTNQTRRSASGARQSGDDYQHVVAWNRILLATLPDRNLESVEVEALDAGNVDDVVIRYCDRAAEFAQVRFAVGIESPLNTAYLFATSAPGGTSVLQKFAGSWRTLNPGPGGMTLITNRAADPSDGAMRAMDGRTGLLVPAIGRGGPRSATGQARAAWANHLSISEDELLEMLGCWRFQVGRPFDAEMDHARACMIAAGLRSDPASVRVGIDLVRQWVLDGRRRLSADQVRAAIAGLGLQIAEPAAVLHVQALLRDPTASEATETLDWVDLYQGDDAPSRRRTVLPDAYAKVMEPELAAAAERLRNAGHRRIVINGAFRLPTAFAIGAALPRTRGTVLIRQQLTEVWDTNAAPEGDDHLRVNLTEVGDSADIAVVVAVTNDPTQDVAAYLSGGGPQIGAICTILPGRAHDASVSGPGHSVILCQAIRHHVRDALRNRPGGKVHLFMACPGAMALFLGHRWNRVASTIIYEDLSPGYAPTFSVSA